MGIRTLGFVTLAIGVPAALLILTGVYDDPYGGIYRVVWISAASHYFLCNFNIIVLPGPCFVMPA
jgi:hypothetical protein